MEFKTFKTAVAKQFERMQKHELFRVDVDKDTLWATYLDSFPEGTDPIFRERTEHDCSCCRHFIRDVGDVVAIIDGKVESIWDTYIPSEPAYQVVSDALSAVVKSKAIVNTFLHYEKSAGTDKNFEDAVGDVLTWDHFFVNIKPAFVMKNADIATALGEVRALHDVLLRSLTEITVEAVDTVLDLIAQNSLYRGEEHKFAVESFRKLQSAFHKLTTDEEKDLYVWSTFKTVPASVSKMRNTAIGSLLVDLSNGDDLEAAVKSFEAKVAPTNYKRPTALITKAMIEQAKAKLSDLGLTSALERRYANIHDITVNNILFADRGARNVLTGDVFDDLAASVGTKAKNFDKVEEVSIEKFISDVLPRATQIEVLFENKHSSNLVSLVAPVDPTSGNLFKWDNKFSWSYNGEIADSDIRKAVQGRGGRVDGVFRFSHSWNYDKRNASLMDLHVFMPGSRVGASSGVNDDYGNSERVGWNNRNHYKSGGVQDVDYTDAAPAGYVPVENITFPDLSRMPEGKYICKIHNWALRSPTQGGFRAEIEFGGEVFQYEHAKPLKNKEWVTVAEVTLKGGKFEIKHHLQEATTSKTTWGLPTQTFHKVSVMMLSPNFWDEKAVGNKHYFFMLEGCKNDGTARGFFNEFLKSDLDKHRKVFEVVGSKMKVDSATEQLSGLGFSSTQKNSLICRVTGSFTRTIKIVF